MKFQLTIVLGNDAMQTKDDVAAVLTETAARLPKAIYGRIEAGDYGSIFDVNGNSVGKWEVLP